MFMVKIEHLVYIYKSGIKNRLIGILSVDKSFSRLKSSPFQNFLTEKFPNHEFVMFSVLESSNLSCNEYK